MRRLAAGLGGLAALGACCAAAAAHPLGAAPEPEVRGAAAAAAFQAPPASPRAECGPGSRPAPGLQGRVTAQAPEVGYTCNTELVAHEGSSGGYKVERFADRAGRQCLVYDTTLLWPAGDGGAAVIDVTDPARPVRTALLATPAMQSPHESLLLNPRRGLVAAVMGNPTTYPGFVDIWDLNADCRTPELRASLPVGLLGHESGWSPDGNTFYATSLFTQTVTAVDMTNPQAPTTLWAGSYPSHGFTVSDDGNRGYVAATQVGLITVDTSEIQARRPAPQVREVSRLTWPTLSIPQVALPIRIGGRPHLLEVDEFSVDSGSSSPLPAEHGDRVGAARIIDVADERRPKVVGDLRLEVHNPEHREAVRDDPGAQSSTQGYAAHYCNVPRVDDPPIAACSMIVSGLRIFDIRNPARPREIAYFVAPPGESGAANYAMSKPAFDERNHIVWYSDGNRGLYGVRLTNGTWSGDGPAAPRTGSPARLVCASRRNFLIRLPRGLRRARVTVGGRRVKVIRGRRLRARVDLRGMPRRGVVVRITGRYAKGRRIVQTRRYRTCGG
jgi:hypothetical protein